MALDFDWTRGGGEVKEISIPVEFRENLVGFSLKGDEYDFAMLINKQYAGIFEGWGDRPYFEVALCNPATPEGIAILPNYFSYSLMATAPNSMLKIRLPSDDKYRILVGFFGGDGQWRVKIHSVKDMEQDGDTAVCSWLERQANLDNKFAKSDATTISSLFSENKRLVRIAVRRACRIVDPEEAPQS